MRKPDRPFSIKNMRKPLSSIRHLDHVTLDYTRDRIKWRFSWWNRILIFVVEYKESVKFVAVVTLLAIMALLVYLIIVNLPREKEL